MKAGLQRLVESLLYEGYALYPYTPGATKNATPTPFGIAYPPVYAAALPTTFDHLDLRAILHAPPDAPVAGEVRFLASTGERHQAEAHAVTLAGVMVGALAHGPVFQSQRVRDSLDVFVRMSATQLKPHEYEVSLRVENRTPVPAGLERGDALRCSLLSTHPVLTILGGRFASPLDRPTASVNTFPVLATPEDDAIVGAAIMLPDHPQIAPESRGDLFDGTEIEEALLLHVQTLSDEELDVIDREDPTVRAMIARAAAATPEDIISLHGRVTVRDPQTDEPPRPPDWLTDPTDGETTVEIGGVRYERGTHVVLRPRTDTDLHARMLAGRAATVERIFTDYDGRTHFGVTVDDDPGQDLMRDTGRYLFFFAEEVEVVPS